MRKVDDGLWDLNEDIDIVLDSERERWYLHWLQQLAC